MTYTDRRDFDKNEKIHCPYCGKTKTIYCRIWDTISQEEPENKATITEWQCRDCEGVSFWI